MRAFVRFTLKQRVLLNLVFVLVMALGAWALLRSPVERYPNIHFGKVFIETYFPGASPDDVEALVTRKIEDALEDMDNLEYVLSHSYRERSSILVKFIDDTDYQAGYDELRFRVLNILGDLPPTIEPPRFNELDVNDWFPAITVNVVGDRSNRTLTLIGEEMKARLERLAGIKEVKLIGERVREFQVLLDPERMRETGITFEQAVQALGEENVTVPAGDFVTTGGEITLRVDERYRSRDQVLATIVRTDGDAGFITIGDIAATARLGYRDPFVLSSVNGHDCVSLQLIKTRQGNAIRIASAARAMVEENQVHYRDQGVDLVLTQDSTVKIRDSMRVLGFNLLLGIILVSLLIYLVMGPRNAALTTVGIPFAFLVTMAIMYLTGNSVNELSLFSFVLVSGIIVDDAIVVVENIYRHIQQGKPLEQAVVDGAAEVFLPVIAATLTTVAAFLPMLIMTGSIGEFFAIIPKAVSYALLASLLECLLILPLHYLDFGPRRPQTVRLGRRYQVSSGNLNLVVEDTPFMALCRRFFNRLLALALRWRLTSLALITVLFGLALFIALVSLTGRMNLIRITFFPDDYSLYYVELHGPAGTPLATTHALVKRIAAEIIADGPGQAASAQGIAGFYLNEDYMAVWGNHLGHVAVTLPPVRERRFADAPDNDVLRHLETMRARLAHFARESGFRLRIRPEKDGPPEGRDINIRVMGQDLVRVDRLSRHLLDFLRTDPGIGPALVDLHDDQGVPGRVLRFRVDRRRIGEYGLSPLAVARLAAAVLDGRLVGKYRVFDEELDLRVRMATDPATGISQLLRTPVVDRPEGPVALGDLGRISFRVEPGFLNRFQGRRTITLSGNLRQGAGISAAMVVRRVTAEYNRVRADYPGVVLDFAGEYESTSRSFTSLAWAFLIALLVIYVILATQFNSFVQPLIIISAVVFGLIGIVYGTFLSRSLFTINSFMAIVGVTGVVVNDALVLIEFINKSYQRGLSRREAIVRGTNVRLRPIILTTLTTTLGLLPMALGIPEYSLVWGTMAMTFVTGLCTATLLTIVLVPVQWDLLAAARERRQSRSGRDTLPTRIVIEPEHR